MRPSLIFLTFFFSKSETCAKRKRTFVFFALCDAKQHRALRKGLSSPQAYTMAPGDPGFVVGGGVTSTGALGFGSGDDVVKSIGKKQRELEAGFTASRTDKYAGFDSEIGFNAAGRALEKDGGDFNTVGLQGAHDYSATEAGRFILEEKRKFEAAKAAMSETKVRDADGTIDRVDDSVAEALMPLLYAMKERCRTEHINLESVFQVR